MILTDLVGMIFRLAELAFAAIVAGVNGAYLHQLDEANVSSWDQGRNIYAEVVAGISIFLALLWLFPFSSSFVHWPVDILISVTWFVAFGLLVNALDSRCGGVFDWNNISFRRSDQCGLWKTAIAFSFLSAICWLVSAIIGLVWIRDHQTRAYRRRTWGRSRV